MKSLYPTCNYCPSIDGCPTDKCPDFEIKRNDTKPPFKVNVSDEDGPLDLTGLILEANMWANAKLKTAITSSSTTLTFADNVGFYQVLVGDVIAIDRVRSPEYMIVTGFDEDNYTVTVERGYNDTTSSAWKKGTKLKIFRFMNSLASTEMICEDVEQIDGTIENQIIESYLVYNWQANDTCVPGCFWLEFKLMSIDPDAEDPSEIPDCYSGLGVLWVRRFPTTDGYLIKINNSPTKEL